MNSKIKNKVEEPAAVYETVVNNETSTVIDAWEELPIHVKNSIEFGLEQSEKGLFLTHEEVMSNLKEKYPFLNGI